MTIPIKIECGCGQKYAFDIEPLQGRMPSAIACPSCGIDGTEVANDFIARAMPAEAPPQNAHSASPRGGTRPVKEIDILRVTNEARAKTMWGDEKPDVIKFIMLQGVQRQEAIELAEALFAERASSVRKNGIGKIITGGLMMCVPVIAWFIFHAIGFLPLKLFGLLIAFGLWGVYRVLKGIIMFIAPKSEPGDVASQ